MPARSRRLAEGLIGSDAVYLLARTGTTVDVGRWLRRGRVWVAALGEALVLVAGGPRPLAERIDYDRLGESRYNHVTGQLALAPAALEGAGGLAFPPIEAYQVLAQIYRER